MILLGEFDSPGDAGVDQPLETMSEDGVIDDLSEEPTEDDQTLTIEDNGTQIDDNEVEPVEDSEE